MHLLFVTSVTTELEPKKLCKFTPYPKFSNLSKFF